MNKKSLTEYSNEELQKAIKSRKFVFGLMLGIEIMWCLLTFLDLYQGEKFSVKTMQPLIFLGLLSITWSEYKKAKDEMDNRNK